MISQTTDAVRRATKEPAPTPIPTVAPVERPDFEEVVIGFA